MTAYSEELDNEELDDGINKFIYALSKDDNAITNCKKSGQLCLLKKEKTVRVVSLKVFLISKKFNSPMNAKLS